ncbi:unnamed protein product [Rotaria sp. Silwood2]|nr:unnamed protein product [Rotaria sp. Silwood2]CAF4826969.1 unnamed protein product [Rotaria sp. Silwood2]
MYLSYSKNLTFWITLKQELLQLIIPRSLVNSPNTNPFLNYIWNSQSIMQQQQRLAHVLDIVRDLIALSILLAAESITFILDLVCLASRRDYLKLDK